MASTSSCVTRLWLYVFHSRVLSAGVAAGAMAGEALRFLDGYDGVLVRTMPPGSLEQVVFRMDLLHTLQARGVRVLNPPRAVETCVDKYLATARLAAAGLPVPPTVACQHADAALDDRANAAAAANSAACRLYVILCLPV